MQGNDMDVSFWSARIVEYLRPLQEWFSASDPETFASQRNHSEALEKLDFCDIPGPLQKGLKTRSSRYRKLASRHTSRTQKKNQPRKHTLQKYSTEALEASNNDNPFQVFLVILNVLLCKYDKSGESAIWVNMDGEVSTRKT
jgi:hypothetical protein